VLVEIMAISFRFGLMLQDFGNATANPKCDNTVSGAGPNFHADGGSRVRGGPVPRQSTVELEECVSQSPGRADHILIQKGVRETQGYRRLRNAGYVCSSPQPGTQPLHGCYSDAEKSRLAANAEDCANLGEREVLLGYDLEH
jgi:hypothetical protein